MERRATSKDTRRKCASSSDWLSTEISAIKTLQLVPRHMPPDFGQVSLAGAGFVDELAVEHHHQTIRQFQEFVEVLADQQHRGSAVAGGHDFGMDLGDRGEIEA